MGSHRRPGADTEEHQALFDELAALVLTQRATFATPVWLNAGLAERPVTSACFILKAEDSIPQLLDWNTREGLIFQQGGGAGINLSSVRSSREPMSRGGLASGPVSFMRASDAWAATIRAGGRARRGAKMVVLDASHPDILKFVEAKAREEDRGRALLAAGYPLAEVAAWLAFQHANHSMRVSDEFMHLAVSGGEWALRAVTTGEVLETLPARRVLCASAEAASRCGTRDCSSPTRSRAGTPVPTPVRSRPRTPAASSCTSRTRRATWRRSTCWPS